MPRPCSKSLGSLGGVQICSCSKTEFSYFQIILLIKFILKRNERPQEVQHFLFLKENARDTWHVKNFTHPISKILKFYEKWQKFLCAFGSFKTNIKICLLPLKRIQIPGGTDDNVISFRKNSYILKVFVWWPLESSKRIFLINVHHES